MKSKSNTKPLTFTIDAGMFPVDIRVIITNNFKKAVDYINRKQHLKGSDKYNTKSFEKTRAKFCPCENASSIIWMPKRPKTVRQLSAAAHEILHAVFDCLDYVGVEYSSASEETFTYLHTHLMQQFLTKCKNK